MKTGYSVITPASEKDFAEIVELWERSVRATHDFLPESYLQEIKTLLPSILPEVQLFITRDENGKLAGFLGTAGQKIEMLFIDPAKRGAGLGRLLTRFAMDETGARLVDVNEQNEQAVGFYLRMGFKITGRNELDGLGRPFPLLLMELA